MEIAFCKDEGYDAASLRQGDVLVKGEGLSRILSEVHPYYASEASYTHFVVLTQSCDLVRRDAKPPRTRYITLAAARPLKIVVDRFLQKHRFSELEFPLLVCQKGAELYAKQLLERLLHNTEESFFFIRKGSVRTVTDDICVFLPLSVALRASHYDACLECKVGQMDHIFAAKLGWLTGTLYSRVATPDIEETMLTDAEAYKADFFAEVLLGRTAWLSSAQYKILKTRYRDWKAANPGADLRVEDARELLLELPDDVSILATRAANVLADSGLIERGAKEKAINVLQNDLGLKKLVRAGTQ